MMRKIFQKNIPFWSSIGASIEYYDFVAFAYLVPTLSIVFFEGSESAALLKTYMISSIAYFARPLGSLVYGLVGDVRGRYKTFLSIMYTMTFSTLGIALIPSLTTIGILAPILLFIFRFLQGISFGAELPGAVILVSEHQRRETTGRSCGFIISSVTIGSILASTVSFVMTFFYTEEEICTWAWRLPFLVGGLLGFLNLWVRKNLSETPVFLSRKEQEKFKSLWEPAKIIFKEHKIDLMLGTFLGFGVSCLIITYTYFPRLFPQFYGYDAKTIYWCLTLGLIWSAILTPCLGHLGDHWGKNRLFLGTSILGLFCMSPLFSFIQGGLKEMALFCIGFQTLIAGFVISYFPILISLFQPKIRFTAITICYNITYAIVSTFPILFTSLLASPPVLLIKILIGCIVFSLMAFLGIMRRKQSFLLQKH